MHSFNHNRVLLNLHFFEVSEKMFIGSIKLKRKQTFFYLI